MLAHGVTLVEQGVVEDAMRLMTYLTKLPNKQFQAWAYFFLGLLYQTKGSILKREASAQGKALTGLSSKNTHHNLC